jgi:hypothetical protein
VAIPAVTGAGLFLAVGQRDAAAAANDKLSFDLVPSSGITACLPNAHGHVTVTPGDNNDILRLTVTGLPPDTGFDFFVTELPKKPFGVSWYQSDLQTDDDGNGSITVRGILDVETFTVSQGDSRGIVIPSNPAVHQYHLGLWFNDPQIPFDLKCEPGRVDPVVTPFNGEQHAGIQVLNTANFPDNAGPLKGVTK